MIKRTALLAAAVTTLFVGTAAQANVFTDLSIRIGVNQPRPTVERVWVEPVYQTQTDRVWVEPVYQTQVTRVWHEAVYEDRVERVLVPDRFETRVETSRDYHGWTYRNEIRVLVQPAHYEDRTSHVLVSDGCWQDVPQQVCVTEGHWTEASRQVVVREGYWTESPVCAAPASDVRFEYDQTVIRHEDDRRDDRHDDRHDPRADQMSRAHAEYARDRDDRSPRDDRGRRY